MRSKVFLMLGVTVMLLTGCTAETQPIVQEMTSQPQQQLQGQQPTADFTKERYLECKFFTSVEFSKHITLSSAYELEGELAAGVVPHHLVAGHMTASFFARAGQEQYDTVVLVGPSHFPNASKVITTFRSWGTPFGILEADRDFVSMVTSLPGLSPLVDNNAVENDHAVGALVPYIKNFLPNAQFGVVLMANGTPYSFVSQLAKEIHSLSQIKKVLLVASIDFSHYLDPQAAAQNDEHTMAAVESFDIVAQKKMTDANIDSPETMTVLLEYLQLVGINSITQLDHSSSDRILGLPMSHPAMSDGTTTYFIYGAVQP